MQVQSGICFPDPSTNRAGLLLLDMQKTIKHSRCVRNHCNCFLFQSDPRTPRGNRATATQAERGEWKNEGLTNVDLCFACRHRNRWARSSGGCKHRCLNSWRRNGCAVSCRWCRHSIYLLLLDSGSRRGWSRCLWSWCWLGANLGGFVRSVGLWWLDAPHASLSVGVECKGGRQHVTVTCRKLSCLPSIRGLQAKVHSE